jgi:uncharacterized protein (TIGR02611 family)
VCMSTSVAPSGLVVSRTKDDAPDGFLSRTRGIAARLRGWIHRHPRLRAPYRVLVAMVGFGVVVIGLILVPLPGPGWLIVFIGVAVLGTEFPSAHRLTEAVRRLAHRARLWWRARRQRQAAANGSRTVA